MIRLYPLISTGSLAAATSLDIIWILHHVRQPKRSLLHVIAVDKALALSITRPDPGEGEGQTAAASMRIKTPPCLHAPTRLKACEWIGGDAVFVRDLAVEQSMPVRIATREVQKVDTCENDEESTKKGEGVDSIRGVEAAEENERRTKSGGCECDVV